jgi:glycosyltransferase involved in cell wall biosynthesis
VVLAIDGAIRMVVERAEAGSFVEPGQSQALAQAVTRYAHDPGLCARQGRAGRAFVEAHFRRDDHARQLRRVLKGSPVDDTDVY